MTAGTATKQPNRLAARVYGILFLLAFLSYGTGSALVANLADSNAALTEIASHKAVFTLGIVLMAIVHTFANVGLAIVMLPILKPYNNTVAYGYVALAIAATVVAIVGAVFLMLLIPLSEASGSTSGSADMLAVVLKKAGFYGYQLGMTIWGMAGLLFCYLLFISKRVPRVFPFWGAIGYAVFMVGTLAEVFGFPIGLMLSAPGGLFEIALSLWLIFRGFTPESHA